MQQNGELIDNWDDLIVEDENQQQQQNDQDVPPTVDEEQKPPVAVDDAFGARPGSATLLPVLLNDYDPNADVLVITADERRRRERRPPRSGDPQSAAAAHPRRPRRRGPIAFSYTISDGRGGTATATVTRHGALARRELPAAAGAHHEDHRASRADASRPR